MTIRKRYIFGVVVLAAAGGLLWHLSRPEPVSVSVAAVERGVVRSTVANTRAGTVTACRRARLSPATGGPIATLPVSEGDDVRANDVLLEIWNVDLQAELKLARKDALASRARADEACVSARVALREADRLSRLLERGLTAEEIAERARGEAESREAACRAVRQNTAVADARIEAAEAALERTRLRAPFDGTIAEINGEVGEFVTPSPIGIPTPPAVDLVDNTCLYISAPIDEVDAPRIRAGMPAEVTLDAFPGRRFDAKVRRVAPYVLDIEKQARSVEIEAEIAEAQLENLLPGYSADVEVILAERDGVLHVPTQAVIDDREVYRFDPERGLIERRKVQTGIGNWERTEIVSGLAAGDLVVTSVDREGVTDGASARADVNRP